MAFAVMQWEAGERPRNKEALSAPARGRMPHITRSTLHTAVFVTSSTEYEVRGGVCCAVRDRMTGALRVNHRAIGMQLVRMPQRGEILRLVGDSHAVLMTSILEEVRTIGGAEKRADNVRSAQLQLASSY